VVKKHSETHRGGAEGAEGEFDNSPVKQSKCRSIVEITIPAADRGDAESTEKIEI
jgi:hypothetical protein